VAFSSMEVVQSPLTILGVRVRHLLHHSGSFSRLDVCKTPKYFTNIRGAQTSVADQSGW
jgi:hypothetical protein